MHSRCPPRWNQWVSAFQKPQQTTTDCFPENSLHCDQRISVGTVMDGERPKIVWILHKMFMSSKDNVSTWESGSLSLNYLSIRFWKYIIIKTTHPIAAYPTKSYSTLIKTHYWNLVELVTYVNWPQKWLHITLANIWSDCGMVTVGFAGFVLQCLNWNGLRKLPL